MNNVLGAVLHIILFGPEVGAVITHHLQRRMLRFGKIKQLVEGHAAGRQGGWAWDPGCLTPQL